MADEKVSRNPIDVSLSDLEPFSSFVQSSSLKEEDVKRGAALGEIPAYFFVQSKGGYYRANCKSLESQIFVNPEKMDVSFHDQNYGDGHLFKVPGEFYSIKNMFVGRSSRVLRAVGQKSNDSYEVRFEVDGEMETVGVNLGAGAVLAYLLEQAKSKVEWTKWEEITRATNVSAVQMKDLFTAKDAHRVFKAVVESDPTRKGFYRIR